MRASLALRATVATVLGLALAFFGLSAASAHSDTFSSIPAAGSTNANVTQIQFTFAEPVQKNMGPEIVLQASGGVNIPTGAPTFDVTGATMTVPITGGALPNGNYAATYRVVSIDGHVASGVLNFTVAGSTATASVNAGNSSAPVVTAVPNELVTSSDGWSSTFMPLIVSLVALLPLIVGLVILIAIIRRRERLGKRR